MLSTPSCDQREQATQVFEESASHHVIPGANPKLYKAMATMELREMDRHLQRAKQAPMELTVTLMCMANIISMALRLAAKMGAQCQLGVLILHFTKPTLSTIRTWRCSQKRHTEALGVCCDVAVWSTIV